MSKRRTSRKRSLLASSRQLRHETLERRELLAAELSHAVFAPGTSQGYMDDWNDAAASAHADGGSATGSVNFNGSRWTNPVGGPSPNVGDAATVTWGIVPDGTLNNQSQASDLVAFFNGIYGNNGSTTIVGHSWFPLIEKGFDEWSQNTGINFQYEPNDDGVTQDSTLASRGIDGVRPDIRLFGGTIDGNSNKLAFNYYPNAGGNSGTDGDMKIDTADNWYQNNSNGATGPNRGLHNVLVHETGHGIGLGHVIPVNQSKVMEPTIDLAFRGAQHDDVLAGQSLYGDRFGDNDSSLLATDLGTYSGTPLSVDNVSIDQDNDTDWFSFEATAGTSLSLSVSPVGELYDVGPDDGAIRTVNTKLNSDLRFQVFGPSGLLESRDATALGAREFISGLTLTETGTYLVQVAGSAVLGPAAPGGDLTPTQLYSLSISDQLSGPNLIAIRPDAGELLLEGDTLYTAPQTFNLLFEGGADIDEASISTDTIKLVRSGTDGTFGDGNEIEVALGYVGLAEPGNSDPDNLQRIVVRAASSAAFNSKDDSVAFPDDLYQIRITGSGDNPLASQMGEAFNAGEDFELTFRLDRGVQVVSVVPQPVSRNTQELVFNGAAGDYRLEFGGEETELLNVSDTDAEILVALNALPNVQPGDIENVGIRQFLFTGHFAGEQIDLLEVTDRDSSVGTIDVVRLDTLDQASNQITVYFDDQVLEDSQATDPKFYRLVNTAVTTTVGDDLTMLPASVTYDPVNNSAVLFFATELPEGTYRLDVGTPQLDNSVMGSAVKVGSLSLGNDFVESGFLGDASGRSDDDTDTDLYEVQIPAGGDFRVDVAPQLASLGLQLRVLDSIGAVVGPVANGAAGVSVVFNQVIAVQGTYFVEITSGNGETGPYSIEAGLNNSPISGADANTSIYDATMLGQLGAATIRISAQIEDQTILLPPRPGSEDEPGHRLIQREQHIGSIDTSQVPWVIDTPSTNGTTPVAPVAVTEREYNFPETFANQTDPTQPYLNLITEDEKQIVRDIYEIYSQNSGFEFVESLVGGGTKIGKGDLRALSPSIGPADGVAGLGGSGAVMINGAIYNQSNRFFGDGFTGVMFHELGHSLGLSHAYDLPATMGGGLPNDLQLGDHDIVHLQRIVPANATDIDMYRFDVVETGRLQAETIAERLANTSLLNTALQLFRELPDGNVEMIAQNDQYFGADSFIDVLLEEGTYFVGVTSTGNSQYDPHVPDSGYGGTSGGAYDLQISFAAESIDGALRDTDGTVFDGDGDGAPGGVFSFWFQASDENATIFVDKANDSTAAVDGTGSLSDPLDNVGVALQQAGTRIVVPVGDDFAALVGQTFSIQDGVTVGTFTFTVVPNPNQIDVTGVADEIELATRIMASVNASALTTTATISGRVVQFSGLDNLDLTSARTLVETPNVVRVLGNGGDDADVKTLEDNHAYLIGQNVQGNVLEDGAGFLVPQGVTVMLHAGALVKLRKANVDVGSSAVQISRAQSVIQVLGTPEDSVFLRSYHDDSAGGDSDGVGSAAGSGDFGGIVFRSDSDFEADGVFLNHVNHLDSMHGGGKVFVGAVESVYAPIHIIDARPTVSFNFITSSDDAAVSASPDSFEETNGRIGPDINSNFLVDNTIDGLFLRVETPQGSTVQKLTVSGRFDDIDIPHVLTENLVIAGGSGGPVDGPGGLMARAGGRLMIDPGMVLKLNGARIEMERGSGSLIAEGTVDRPVIFTSFSDDRFGGSGSFDTDSSPDSLPSAGDWGGLYFGQATFGSLDNTMVAFAGGSTAIEGGSANFNAIEVHQASVRVANSLLQSNASGNAGGVRNGRGTNQSAVIYVRGAQPQIIDNIIADNAGAAISINANSMRFEGLRDRGRSTGYADAYTELAANHGPLIRLNRLEGNSTNGLEIRGEEMTTEGVWDDTDIVHVLRSEIIVDNHHSYSGLTLQSSNTESLVVKLAGGNAGLTATGTPAEIIDRIGGTVHVLGTVGHPVVMTHIADDSVGAGYTPAGEVMFNTNNTNDTSNGTSGGWRGLRFDEFSNDRNVAVVRELENPLTSGKDVNSFPFVSQLIGDLAPDQQSGDENRRLGFEVNGYISPDDANDIDVFSFTGTAGTGIWIDVDRTDTALDAIVEVINTNGTVLNRSMRSGDILEPGTLNAGEPGTVSGAGELTQVGILGGDHYTQNFRDPGLFYVLPGTTDQAGTYFVRVRSNPANAGSVTALDGESRGEYSLQIRLDQVQEFPGSTVQYADIRFANTGIDVRGLPAHSPLIGEAGELAGNNDTAANAQVLVNLLETDVAALSIAGDLSADLDIDWYQFDMAQTGVQVIPNVNDGAGTIAVVFDIDYADNVVRGDTTIAVFDSEQRLIYSGRESNIADDQPSNPDGSLDDHGRGSLGVKDGFVGPIHVTPGGSYFVAVMSDNQLPSAMTGVFQANPANAATTLVRLEPVNSVERVIEDHIGAQGYVSGMADIAPTGGPLFDVMTLDNHVEPYAFSDVALYVKSANALHTVDPFVGTDGNSTRVGAATDNIGDIVMRSDGRFYGYQSVAGADNQVGNLVEINPEDGSAISTQSDQITGRNPTLYVTPAALADVATSDVAGALTFRRNNTNDYSLFYAVRETDSLVPSPLAPTNSKLYSADSGTGSATGRELGDIQPGGVTFSATTIGVSDGTAPGALIDIESKIPGTAGDFTINIAEGNVGSSVITADALTGTISILLDNDPNPTAGGIVDLINGDATARTMVTANVRNDNSLAGPGEAEDTDGALAGNYTGTGGSDGVPIAFSGLNGPLSGRVTGLAYADFNGGVLFGVTDAGELILINDTSGQVLARADFGMLAGDFEFQGLALGPQNVEGGTYANTLFAITRNGLLHAIDPAQLVGNLSIAATLQNSLVNVFDTNNDGVADSTSVDTGRTNVEGLAFSPLDFNMWHTTNRRGDDAGHGINEAPDSSREAAAGGESFYFGFEGAQHGILNPDVAADLASNPLIADTYNMPGGGYGSLSTDRFDLQDSVYQDRPTLYFNYFLDTEAQAGTGADFRDSARVFISRDDGANWELVTTNNSALGSELPGFLSHLSDAGINYPKDPMTGELPEVRQEHQQIRQELHDNTLGWRQARVDLSQYAGLLGLKLRFDFSTAGKMIDGVGGDIEFDINNNFGELDDVLGNERSIRSTDNLHEGFYIDDIIIGYTERGEMVTNAVADPAITNLFGGGQRTNDSDPAAFPDILNGEYQLEVRRTDEYIAGTEIAATFDTNVRHVQLDSTPANGITGLLADRNRERAQGVFILDSNFIADSLQRGINVEPGTAQANGGVPHPGSTINFPQLNQERLVPGIVIQNNVITGSSGIRFAGENTPSPQRPVPFGRIINNTVVGDNGTGVGIEVVGLASPTLINNVVADLGVGIANGGVGTVVRANLFQLNGANGAVGSEAILAAAGDPLFLDAANRNYILDASSGGVDSSQNTEQDRLNYLNFKTEIGIPASPIFAPDRDIYGQLRVDSNAAPGGGGSEVFKDRGATDRADTDAPYAVLLNPIDNDSLGEDTDPTTTIVRVTDPLLENFTILLGDGPGPNSPFEGTGVDNLTVDDPSDPNVSLRAITIERNREFLEEGVDYNVGYNELTGVLLLTPLSTLWEPTGVYAIELDNTLIADRVGNRLRPNQTDGSTKFTVIMPQVEIDFGDADPSYDTLIADDGPRHAIIDGATPRLGQFVDGEFDALVVDQDDHAIIGADGNPGVPGDGPFTITNSGTQQAVIDVSTLPNVGDTLEVTSESVTLVFELVPTGRTVTGYGRVPVVYPIGALESEIADLLASSMQTEFAVRDFQASVDHIVGETELTLDALDDEDGVAVGVFDDGAAGQIVFVTPGTDPSDVLTADIVGFLNPLDPWGTNVPVTVAGQGLLQAWVDFDKSGTFDADEQVITDEPVSDVAGGLNVLTIFTPQDAVTGRTWMRVRVSQDAGLLPTEFSIGGETEDYQIDVISVPVPVPQDDFYEFNEDTTLSFPPAVSIIANDDFINPIPDESSSPVDVQYLVGEQPTYGTLYLDVLSQEQSTFGTTDAKSTVLSADGNTAYVADGVDGLRILDVTNPAAITELGVFDTTGDAQSVVLDGTTAYVADGADGLLVLDVSVSASPERVAVYETDGTAQHVTLSLDGTKAYVSDGSNGVVVIDVTVPVLGNHASSDFLSQAVLSADGNTAYVADGVDGLRILDVTNPAAIVELGVFDTTGDAQSVAIDGTTAYVADGADGLRILDVTDPAVIIELGSFDTTDAQSVVIDGTTAYVAGVADGLRILDVTDPAVIIELDFLPTDAQSVVIDGTTAYVAEGADGLRILDVTDPAAIVELGVFDTTDAQSVVIDGTTAYVADGADGLRILDVTDPAAIVESGVFDTTDAQSVVIDGTTAYVADGADGLLVLDVSDPASPERVAVYETDGTAQHVILDGTKAYVSDGSNGLTVLNVSSRELGVFDTTDAQSVALDGTTAYVADGVDGLRILDVADPAVIVQLGVFDTPDPTLPPAPGESAHSVVIDGTTAYVAYGADGLRILDVTDPAAITELGFFNTTDAQSVALDGTLAYVAAGTEGLLVLDIAIPASPARVSVYDTGGTAQHVMLDTNGRKAYVSDSDGGIVVLGSTDFLETGDFIYRPNADFNGVDAFTYRIITQDSGLINGDVPNAYATVTLSVLPVNDIPDASAAAVTGEEDRALRITQSDLLASADPDNEDPSPFVIPAGSTLDQRDEDLMNEFNQTFVITEVQGSGASVTASTPASIANGNNLAITELASGVDIEVTNTTVGDVFSLAYAGKTATFFVDTAAATADDIAVALQAKIAAEFAGQLPALSVTVVGPLVSLSFTAIPVDVVGSGTTFDPVTTDVVNVIAEPSVGDTVSLTLDGTTVVFELIAEAGSPAAGNVGVELLPFSDPASAAVQASTADRLMRAMNTAFVQQGWGVAASIDAVADANQVVIGETAITAGRAFSTIRGEAIALFDHAGALIEMYYIGNTDLNRDNAPTLGGDATNFDEISFVATDDGISIDLVNNRFVYGTPKTAPPATAEITILPQNDVPVANDDHVRMDVADLDPGTDVDSTLWEQFFGAVDVPAPTEDTPLTIPGAFLIQNDLRARATADDENIDPTENDNNDLSIIVASATAGWDTNVLGGSVSVDPATGDVTLVPPTDQFGDLVFSYTIKDLGTNEFIDGSENTQILESLPATVTVAIQPVNDIPVANDRSLRFTESGDDTSDVFLFTADQLISGDGITEIANTPHENTLGLPSPFNEAEQALRVVEFTTVAGGTVGVDDLSSELGSFGTTDAQSVVLDGTTAYVADGADGLRILDVTDLAAIVELGVFDTTDAQSVVIDGTTAYVADGVDGLRILDVADPAAIVQLGVFDTPDPTLPPAPGEPAHSVVIDGTTAYVAYGVDGLRILDVTDPAAITELGFFNTTGDAQSVAIDGTTAYVADGADGLLVLDVSVSASPERVAVYETDGTAQHVTLSLDGTKAYVSDGSNGVVVIDVTVPSLGNHASSDFLSQAVLSVDGNTAYVADGADGLRILDVTDPAAITELGVFDTTDAQSVVIDGTTAYVADGADGLRILDVTDPAVIVESGVFDTTDAQSVVIDGTTAYVADGADGLRILDVTDPAAITELGVFDTTGDAQSVVLDGTTAYVADGADGLLVLDVSVSASPERVAVYETDGTAQHVTLSLDGTKAYVSHGSNGVVVIDVTVPSLGNHASSDFLSQAVLSADGNTAYVADGVDGLRILDVTNPAAIVELGVFDTTGDAQSVVLDGTTAYVADGADGLLVLDVSVSASPERVAVYETDGTAQHVTLSLDGTKAYVSDGSNGVVVIDVTVPVLGNHASSDFLSQAVLSADGNTAYVADGVDGLRILDVTNPAAIVELGVFDTTDAQSVVIDGTTAYVADGADGLRILDVTNPAAISQLGVFDTTDAKSTVLSADGNTAYVADGVDGLRILDVTDPAVISELGVFDTTDAQSVVIDGTTAYVADGVDGLRILNVADPAAIIELGSFDTTDAQSVVIDGTTAYVADGADGLRILDVTDPAAIVESGVFDTTDAQSVVIDGTTAYVADGADGLLVLDVSDPASPERVAVYETDGTAQHVILDGTKAYVSDGSNGLTVLNVSSRELGVFDTTDAQSVAIDGTTAYVADGVDGLRILDVADPAAIVQLGVFDTPDPTLPPAPGEPAHSVVIDGTTAYVAYGADGLRILDVTDPAAITELGFFNTTGDAQSVAIDGTTAYVADGVDGLLVLDVSVSASPEWVAVYETDGTAQHVILDGTKAYVSDGSNGLTVLNVSSRELGVFDTTDAQSVAIDGTTAYVADGVDGLLVLDVSDPASPERVAVYETDGAAQHVILDGTKAYVSDGSNGLTVLNVSSRELGVFDTTDAQSVAIDGTTAYVADGVDGLLVLDVSDPASPEQVAVYETDGTAQHVILDGTKAYVSEGSNGLTVLNVSGDETLTPGDQTLTLTSDTGGSYEFLFTDGVFVSGTFTPTPNYSERSPFAPSDEFTYRVSDDGQTNASLLVGQGYADFDLPDEVSSAALPGTVTIFVTETNDAPGFDIPNLTIDILERDDSVGTVVEGFAESILPGPVTAIDETAHQSVSFTVDFHPSFPSLPGALIQSATLSPTGDLVIVTEPDAVGQATMIVTATDAEVGNPAFVPRTTVETITINVRPVNDAPRLNSAVVNTLDSNGPDEAWQVAPEDILGQAPITYTLREDNTQVGGVMQDYSIPVTASIGVGYQQIGLFDVFTVGPDNEANNDVFLPAMPPFDTASFQSLELIEFGTPSDLDPSVLITDRGGVLTSVVDPGTGLITELLYAPPLDFNESFGGLDSFAYTVRDNNSLGGETFDLGTLGLTDDQLTSTNRVYLKLNPVNDRPVFTPETTEVVVLEDSAEFTRPNYAINILGGPLLTAFDEHSEEVSFSVDLIGQPAFYVDPNLTVADFFSIAPTIDETTGVLNFKPEADVFGAFEFEVLLTDNGLNDPNRGDLNTSIPLTVTIDIRPVNDPPTEDNPTDLVYNIREDVPFDIDEATLLAPFTVGPDNEGFNTDGGDQTLQLSPTEFPTDSREGGVVHYVNVGGNIKIQYTPRIDFVGEDEFVYTVIDDGDSMMLDGTIFSEPRIATKTVTVNIAPVNDRPRYSGAVDQQHLENDGTIAIPGWVTNVMVGPETALDEADQDLLFVFDQLPGSDDLFLTPPTAVIDRLNQVATLSYTLKDDVSGVAVFDVTLVDDGPLDITNEDEWVSDPPRRVTITVIGVNNPPSFDLDTGSVSVAEDSGPYAQSVISNISAGPADELAQTVSFDIAPLTAQEAGMFAVQPTISPSGLLQFTTASNQNTVKSGPVTLSVSARDSEGGISEPVDLMIAVSEVNDVPTAGPNHLSDTNEDQILVVPEAVVLASVVDPDLATNDDEVLQVLLVGNTSAFGAQVSFDLVTREITYNPTGSLPIQSLKPGEFLTDSILYKAVDAAGAESAVAATVSLRVDGRNDAPEVLADAVDINLDGRAVIDVLANDRDVDGFIQVATLEIVLIPAFGTVTVNEQGIVTYRAFGTLVANDTFSYSVADDLGARSDPALVTILSNLPPVAENDQAFTYVSEPVTISVLDNDSDSDGNIDDQSVAIQVTPVHGSAVVQANGQVLYTPNVNFVGNDSFQYLVFDDSGRQSNVATVDIVVLASRLQNPSNRFDVTGDGLVTPIDALRILNYIDINGDGMLVLPDDEGPDYFDVSGDGSITANDVLLVLNNLAASQFGSGEQAPQQTVNYNGVQDRVTDGVATDFARADKIAYATCLPLMKDDLIDLLAADQGADDENEDDSAAFDVLDVALTDVF